MSDYKVKQHQLFISSWKVIRTLKKENRISPAHKKMFRKIMWMTFITTPLQWIQQLLFNKRIKKINFVDNEPVFILGHWRSGTTHLHYLLALDKQFSYLENFQAFMFKIAFISKTVMKPILGIFMPKKRPQDNIKINANSPSEEEHPLTNITEKCGMQMFFFPQNISYFDKYDTFADITKAERSDWKKSYYWLLQNIAYYAGSKKKLLLKNPHSMGRIEVLLELFPNAKFIHIHRNPYEVYNSNVHLYTKTISTQFLQDFNTEDIEERVIYCYEKIMQKFFDTWSLIPDDNKIEVSFSDLSNQPMETLANIYSALNLGDFSKVSPSFEAYLNKEKDYKKNKFLEIRPEILEDINTRWQFSFNKLGYNIENNGD